MIDFEKKISNRELLIFLYPMILSGIFQQIFQPYSTAVAARYLPEQSLAIIGALGSCRSVQNAVFVGMTTGFAFCINRAAGDRDSRKYFQIFREALLLEGGLFIISIVLACIPEPILKIANVPDTIMGESRWYLSFLLIAEGIFGMENLLTCVIQGAGNTKLPSFAVSAATVLQAVILWILLEFCHIGIEAVPISVICYHLIVCFFLIGYLIKTSMGKKLAICFREKCNVKNRREDIAELLKSGATKASMMLMISLSFFVMQRRVNLLSIESLAGFAHASSLNAFLQQPINVFAIAGGVISAHTIGGKNIELFRFYNRRLLTYSGICCLFFILTVIPTAPILIRIMAGNVSEEIIYAGVLWLRIAVSSHILLALLMICRNALQAMGRYRILLLLGFIEMSVNLIWGISVIPRWGYEAFCVSTVFRWGLPAVAAWTACRMMNHKVKC